MNQHDTFQTLGKYTHPKPYFSTNVFLASTPFFLQIEQYSLPLELLKQQSESPTLVKNPDNLEAFITNLSSVESRILRQRQAR